MALALRRRGDMHASCSTRIESDGRGRLRAVLGTGSPPLLGRKDRGDVAHVGYARLHDRGVADPIQAALRTRRFAPRLQFSKLSILRRNRHGARVVAGIEEAA